MLFCCGRDLCVLGSEGGVNLGFPPHSVGFKGRPARFAVPACYLIPPGLL